MVIRCLSLLGGENALYHQASNVLFFTTIIVVLYRPEIPVFYPTVSNRLKENLMVNVLYDTHIPFSVSTQGFPTTCI